MTLGIETPGKIIAVHLSYFSRMEQRGREPEKPSYFFKPSSSLAPTGGVIERPAGTELLAFEGEVALVIGKAARRVAPEEAWQHVSHVTAANDFGIYDMRAVDKGSNVRSKGGDGFTPIGPKAISTAGLKETDFRVRAWVNGELVQEDTSDKMKFSFSTLVADLSQLMTLEPGDVILTGTPAGSSVVVPGDTVEVEVDVPADGAKGANEGGENLKTGRLKTTVSQGTAEFADWGSKPAVNDLQKIEAWGSEQEHAAAVEAGKAQPLSDAKPSEAKDNDAKDSAVKEEALTPELREMLAEVAVATVSAALRKRGYVDVFIEGVFPLKDEDTILGTAKTLRFIPFRPDLFKEYGGGYNAQKRAFDTVNEGEVLVVEARGVRETGTVGDVLALRAQVRGAAGIVTDGGVRDFAEVQGFEIPVFAQGAHPSVLGRRHVPWETDVTIACGGAAVQPGDIIMGDRDGVLVIPPHLLEEVVKESYAQEKEDAWIAKQVEAGHPVDGLFPMNASWRERYEAETGN